MVWLQIFVGVSGEQGDILVIANILINPLIELATDLPLCFDFVAPVYGDMSTALILLGDWCGPVSELTLT